MSHAPPPANRLVDTFIEYLKAEGVRAVFGVPGGLLHPFFDALERDPDTQLIVAKHEEGAAFMADGFARTQNKLAVCAGTAGPGSTNLLTGVAVAHADGVPLLVITGQAPSRSIGKGANQEMAPQDIDIVGMFRPVTKYSAGIESADRFTHHLRRALRLALSGRPGPVHLNVPVDFWSQPCTDTVQQPESYRPSTFTFDRDAVDRASKELARAEFPVILAGSGIRTAGAQSDLLRLAEYLEIPVATTPRSKGVFPEDHPLSLGGMGWAGHPAACDAILGEMCDVLFVAGASLNESTTFGWSEELMPRRQLIHLDIDIDRISRTYPADIALAGHAKTVLHELYFHVKRARNGHPVNSQWGREEAELSRRDAFRHPELRESRATPVTPQRWRQDLNEVLPHNALVFSDIGGHMLFNIHNLQMKAGQDFILNLNFGSMGHGTCAPIGAKVGAPDRPVFAIIGDGCFTMNGMELIVASDYDIPVIWIIENNQMHGITHHGSKMVGDGKPMECIINRKPLDVPGLAGAMGLETFVVTEPGQMQEAVSDALARNRPAVIDVRVDASYPPPLADRAKTIGGFRE